MDQLLVECFTKQRIIGPQGPPFGSASCSPANHSMAAIEYTAAATNAIPFNGGQNYSQQVYRALVSERSILAGKRTQGPLQQSPKLSFLPQVKRSCSTTYICTVYINEYSCDRIVCTMRRNLEQAHGFYAKIWIMHSKDEEKDGR